MMMQNSTISAMLFNPKVIDLSQRSYARESAKADDTFMQMLSERMNASKDAGLKNRPFTKTELPIKADNGAGDTRKVQFKPNATAVDGMKRSEHEKISSDSEPKEVLKADETKKEAKKTLTTLEAMLALLEQLMARLDGKTGETASAEAGANEAMQDILAVNSQNADPMAILKALLEGNAEKLEALMNQTNESQLPSELQDILGKIRELLENLGEGTNANSFELTLDVNAKGAAREDIINGLKAQVSDVIARLKDQISELKTQIGEISDQEGQLSIDAIPMSEGSSVDNGSKDESKADEKASHTSGASGLKEMPQAGVNAQQTVQGNQASDAQPVGQTVIQPQTGIGETSVKVEKTPLPLSQKPLAQTVTNQVMMKVKLMAGENKQEMEMHLKPESLGKLSLKIIHERGEILAKITAENEQVKGILESNMQLLKDALEKSGLSVQSLSVSVGNKEDQNPSGQELNEQMRSSVRNASSSVKAAAAADIKVESERIREYYHQTSQIDLTA